MEEKFSKNNNLNGKNGENVGDGNVGDNVGENKDLSLELSETSFQASLQSSLQASLEKQDALEGGFATCSSFHGNFTHAIDSKFRVNLPAEYRRVLLSSNQTSVVITNYVSEGAKCLEGFSLSSWIEFENKLRSKSRFDAKLQRLENFYLSRACECQIDKSGRILLPEYLRVYAGLSKDVTFTSSIHGFRIWDSRVWEYVFKEAEKALLADPNLFAEIDI